MALVRWEPVSMNRLFNSLFDTPTGTAAIQRRWVPAMDLSENDDAYILRVDLPGMSPDDVRIEMEGRVLTVSGERKAEHETEEAGYRRIERSFGSFRRSVTLPDGVDPEAITASYDAGVLTVRVPKPEAIKPHKVAIAVEGKEAKPALEA